MSVHSFFTPFGKQLFAAREEKQPLPFHSHPQFAFLSDILSRKEAHHVMLLFDYAPGIYPYFMESFLSYIQDHPVPQTLKKSEMIYIDLKRARLDQKHLEQDFEPFIRALDALDHLMILVFVNAPWLTAKGTGTVRELEECISHLMSHDMCRIIYAARMGTEISQDALREDIYPLEIDELIETDKELLLQKHALAMEAYHHVLISDELLKEAYRLSDRYLNSRDVLTQTMLLLDSAAARESSLNKRHSSLTPSLTANTLLQVIADWTHIPLAHLKPHCFKSDDFIERMQQKVIDQETAIALIGCEWQKAADHSRKGPYGRFLFAGPNHTGKKLTAIAFVETLFEQSNLLFCTSPATQNLTHLLDLTLHSNQAESSISLAKLIRRMPYAVILIENIETASPLVLEGLIEIFRTGYLHDDKNIKHYFTHATIILTTTVGDDKLLALTQKTIPHDQPTDLLQLIMNEQQETLTINHYYSPEDIQNIIMPELISHFSDAFCREVTVIPFLPLSLFGIEKIIKVEIEKLVKTLKDACQIELDFAPEVLRYLMDKAIREAQYTAYNINLAIIELNYCVKQAIENDKHHASHTLYVQLNETGEMLKCLWQEDHKTASQVY